MTALSEIQKRICDSAKVDGSGLKAIIVNATLKHPSLPSHTDTLLDVVAEIFRRNEVEVDRMRLSQFNLAPGVYPDMTEHGWPHDDWPGIKDRVLNADICILGTPIWLGEKSSAKRGRALRMETARTMAVASGSTTSSPNATPPSWRTMLCWRQGC